MEMEGSSLWSATLVVLGILVTVLATFLWKHYSLLNDFKKNNVPYRKPALFFGSTLAIMTKKTSFAEFFQDLYSEFPKAKYSGVFEFTNPVYILRDPELIKSVTVKHFDHFPDHKGFGDEEIDPLFGGNIFSMKGERWKEMRSIISPVFTSSKMRAMFDLMSKCADDLTAYLEKQPRPVTLEMKDIYTRYTNDVIATTAFGISVNSLENKENEFYIMGKDATHFGGFRSLKMFLLRLSPALMKFLKLHILTTKVSNFFLGLVNDTISTRKKQGITRPDLLHLLMQAKHKESDQKLTITEITAQAFIFFFAGFDTSSTLMCFASHQLAIYPELQDKVVADIDAAFDEDEKLSYEKVNHLKYLEMFLNETLRYYPPAVFTDRVNAHEFELPPATETANPILVKPGDRLWIPIFAIHRDPEFFPEPDKFDPERFSAENKSSINPFAFLPFGVGPRTCPGNRFALMETKLVLCSVLRKYRICVGSKTHLPLVINKNSPAMSAHHGFWLDIVPRDAVVN